RDELPRELEDRALAADAEEDLVLDMIGERRQLLRQEVERVVETAAEPGDELVRGQRDEARSAGALDPLAAALGDEFLERRVHLRRRNARVARELVPVLRPVPQEGRVEARLVEREADQPKSLDDRVHQSILTGGCDRDHSTKPPAA